MRTYRFNKEYTGYNQRTYKASNAADAITVSGTLLKIRALKGNDVITVKGTYNEIYGDAGNDKIKVYKGEHEVFGGAGKDTITILSGSSHRIAGGSGNDNITINKGNAHDIHGNSGNDKITVKYGKDHFIYGDAGNDTITISKNAGKDIMVFGDAGKDTIYVKGGSNAAIYGGASSDTIVVTGGKNSFISGGLFTTWGDDSSSDIIKVKSGTGHSIYGAGGNDKITVSGGSKMTVDGGNGNDTITITGGSSNRFCGNDGKDTFVVSKLSRATITDYTAGSDTLKVTGTITKTTLNNKNMVINVGTGVVTLTNAAGRVISVTDGRGSYKMSKSAITLGSNFTGTMDAAKFLSTVTKIDGKSSAKSVTIKGNAKANTIYGGSGANTIYGYTGNDKLYGYAGNDVLYGGNDDDTLYGGAGNDTLSGGAGCDAFIYANGDGNDTISDYIAGEDILKISNGYISKAALANGDKDMVFTVGKGTIVLKNAASKTIELEDSRGFYTLSQSTIALDTLFTGTMDASNFLPTVTEIDGSGVIGSADIIGNAQDNAIYAADYGGTVSGGAGNDKFVFGDESYGVYTISDYMTGEDVIAFNSGIDYTGSWVNGDNVELSLTTGGSIIISNAAGCNITFDYGNGNTTTKAFS